MHPFIATILLGSGFLTGGCGPAEPEYSLVATQDGGSFKLESIAEITRPDGKTALLLSYRTDLELTDDSAMKSEVSKIWESFRPEVERQGLRVAVIRASQWEQPSWERRGRASQFVIERSTDGQWNARPDDAATSSPSAAPRNGF
jgi:hypothetical protein